MRTNRQLLFLIRRGRFVDAWRNTALRTEVLSDIVSDTQQLNNQTKVENTALFLELCNNLGNYHEIEKVWSVDDIQKFATMILQYLTRDRHDREILAGRRKF